MCQPDMIVSSRILFDAAAPRSSARLGARCVMRAKSPAGITVAMSSALAASPSPMYFAGTRYPRGPD